jgi:hypothetical protein
MAIHPAIQTRRLPRWAAVIAGTLVGIALVASACGGASAPNSVAHLGNSAPTTTAPPAGGSGAFPNLQQMYEADLVYAGCMRSHGDARFPDPVLVNNGQEHGLTMADVDQNSPQFISANNDCKHLLPNDGNGPSQAQLAQMMTRALKYSQCMRSHGLPNFPDPTESPNGISLRLDGIDPNSAPFRSAQSACRSLSPGG